MQTLIFKFNNYATFSFFLSYLIVSGCPLISNLYM